MEPRVLLATYTVQSAVDSIDPGSLRWALIQANAVTEPGVIRFAIPGSGSRLISMNSALPRITTAITIDGTSQPGFAGQPLIQIDGSHLAGNQDGVVLTVGGSIVEGLAITGFSGAGILVSACDGNLLQGNYLGASATGLAAAPNGEGIKLADASLNTIGGTAAGAGNLISGNLGAGVELASLRLGTKANVIEGNLVGVTADGTTALANGRSGILLIGASDTVIGGSLAGAGNVVSGNARSGVELTSGATRNLLLGNRVGTTADGRGPLGNVIDGVLLQDAPSNTIGGNNPGEGNVISGNRGNGVETAGSALANLLAGNQIGTDATGLIPLGNAVNGVTLGAGSNTIGGNATGAGNTIAFNGTGSVGAGVQIVGVVNRNSILSNSIHDNAGLGINLGNGPTPNHLPGTLPSPNDFQNYPLLSLATTDGQTVAIKGALTGLPSASYTVQLFSSQTADPSGFGEGETLLASLQANTNAAGAASFTTALPLTLPPGTVISATATDVLGNTSEFSQDVSIQGVTDLGVTISATPDPVPMTGTITYTIVVTNHGDLDAHGVVLQDTIPSGLAVSSIVASQGSQPTQSGQIIFARLGTVPARSTATLTIVARVVPGAGAVLQSTAAVTMTELDLTPSNNTASISTRVAPVADLRLSISSTASSARIGDSLTFTIVATNQGPAQATSVVVSLPLNPGFTHTSSTATQGTVAFSGGEVKAVLGAISPGASARLTVIVSAASLGTLTPTATVSSDDYDPTPADDTASTSVTIIPTVNLVAAVSSSASPVAVGQTFVYTITATNQGPDPATAVAISNVLPTNVAFVSATSDHGDAPVLSGGTITAAVGSLAPGAVAKILVTVALTTAATPGTSLTDTATASFAQSDTNPADNVATLVIPVRDASNLLVSMTPGNSSIPIGQTLFYDVVVANHGPADEPDAVVAIPLPRSVTVISCTANQGKTPVVSPDRVVADLGLLPVGGSATVRLTVSPLATAIGLLTLTSAAQGYNAQIDPAMAQASSTVTVVASAGLAVSLALVAGSASEGVPFSYTITVRNGGPSDAANVVVSAPLAPGCGFNTASSSQGPAPEIRSGQVFAALGTIPANASATVTIVVAPALSAPSVPRAMALLATAVSDGFDPDPSDNTASASVMVFPSDDLSVTLAASVVTGEVGNNVTLVATVSNHGPSTATGVTLLLPLAPGGAFVAVASGDAPFAVQNGAIQVQLNDLAMGASTSLAVTMRLTAAGTTSWTAVVSGDRADVAPDNNQASAMIQVLPSPGTIGFDASLATVTETVGSAVIPVVRTGGSHGLVTVHYQTWGGNAAPGQDYIPASGILVFADSETVKSIVVPILANPHDNHDESVGLVLDSPTGGAVLGDAWSTALRIVDTDPDFTPPQVTGVQLVGPATAITRIVVNFSEPIVASAAGNLGAYTLSDLGASGLATAPGRTVPLASSIYDPTSQTVALVPAQPLPAGHFFRIQVMGSGPSLLTDLAGNPLAGAGAGQPGTNYVALFARGTTLKYNDADGDLVTLRVTGGGYLDLQRAATGAGLTLQLQGGIAHRTVLSGTVARVKGRGNGMTTLQTIEGLGQFGDIRVNLTSPPFIVRHYPFFLRSGRPLAARPQAPRR